MNHQTSYNSLTFSINYYPFGSVTKGRNFSSHTYRYGFNGKEKDDEVSGSGNEYDFGARIYDPRLGKFLSIDPSFRKYSSWSPYLFAGSNPIRFVDIFGYGPGDVVVAFGGADLSGTGDKGGASTIIKTIQKNFLDNEGGKAQSFASSYIPTDMNCVQSLDIATQAAYDFIKTNHNKDKGKDVKGGKVIIEGYSFGGVLATHLTSRLAADGIKVDVLITVDAAAGPATDNVIRTVEAKVNLNLYQTKTSIIGSHGAPNTGLEKSNKVINVDLSDKNTNHGNIDDLTQTGVIETVTKILKLPPKPNSNSNTKAPQPLVAPTYSGGKL